MELNQLRVSEFAQVTASDAPAPGGGSVSALAGALAAALAEMVAHLTAGREKYAAAQEEMAALLEELPPLRQKLLCAVDRDSRAFDRYMEALAMPKATPEEQAARKAAMEEGLETVVGSGGVRLSGGQAQRLALARTLAHPRPVLVLDDPFSALDRGTEDKVFENLKQYARDKVVILISHRLYHFPEMQRVVFMEEGRCTVDTHAGLCAAAPAYRALYESQTGGAAHEA